MRKYLMIDLEPTPYKFDQYNFMYSSGLNFKVVFVENKNYDWDNFHDYRSLPESQFDFEIANGASLPNKVRTIVALFKNIKSYDYLYIVGYDHFQTFMSLIYGIILKKKIILHSDIIHFENNYFTKKVKYFLYRNVERIIVCNIRNSDLSDFNLNKKTKYFPYYFDVNRMMKDEVVGIDESMINVMCNSEIIKIYTSARLIERKGIGFLIHAFEVFATIEKVVLLIEGEGYLKEGLIESCRNLELLGKVFFLGFNQYNNHSWFIRNSDLIVVPSESDNWGIVVDEGVHLNKYVVSTFTTGSALHVFNLYDKGYLVEYNDVEKLKLLLIEIHTRILNEKISIESESGINIACQTCRDKNLLEVFNLDLQS